MRVFSVAERRKRLARRQLLTGTTTAPSVLDATASMLGWHATDPATPYLSLWARIPGFTIDDLNRALYQDRSVVKHLAMRRTLWVVPSSSLSVVQVAASNRVAQTERRKLIADAERAGVAEDGAVWLSTATRAVLNHLSKHGPASTTQLRQALPELSGSYDPAPGRRWGGETPLAPRILTVMGASGDVLRGPNDGAWTNSRPRWVHTDNWLDNRPAAPQPEHGRAQLVRNWLHTFGPATITDIKWWFGDTLTAVRAALADIDAVQVDLDGTPGYALPDDLEPENPIDNRPWAALLPSLDPTTMGWNQRDWYLGGHQEQVFDRNGNAGPTAWVDGQIVGGWRQDADGRVQVQLLSEVSRDGRNALDRKAAELTDWLAGTRVLARFPSPLSKRGV